MSSGAKKARGNWRSRYPIEAFDPRLRQLWLEAALKEIILSFDTPSEAASFQSYIQMYRAKLRDTGDPDYAKMYRAKTSRKANVLRIYPADQAFSFILDQLPSRTEGVKPLETEPAPSSSLLDEILAEKDDNENE